MTDRRRRQFWLRTLSSSAIWVILLLLVFKVKSQANPTTAFDVIKPIIGFVVAYMAVHFVFAEVVRRIGNTQGGWLFGVGLISGTIVYASATLMQGLSVVTPLAENLVEVGIVAIGPIWDFMALRE